MADVFADLKKLLESQNPSIKNAADLVKSQYCPSASIAILQHGKVTAECISTVGDDKETVFQACSLSKPVTAMAAMKLVDQGKLDLDTPITSYFKPGARDALDVISTPDTAALLEHITLEHLLSHRSGLSVSGYEGYGTEPTPSVLESLAGSHPSKSPQVRLEHLPGLGFAYSGGGYTVLQKLLEAVTGQSFPELMNEFVLQPLGLTRSAFAHHPPDPANHAKAHFTSNTPSKPTYHSLPELAAAGLWTTPTDMLKLIDAMQCSLHRADGFLSQTLARRMLTPLSENGMTLGWRTASNGTAFGHGGDDAPGFKCYVMGFAGASTALDRSGLCIMTNSLSGDVAYSKLASAISYIQGWPVPAIWTIGLDAITPYADKAVELSSEWREWLGGWQEAKWAPQWFLVTGAEERPAVCMGSLPVARLFGAAKPQSGSIDLVLEGLEMMLRLQSSSPKGDEPGLRTIEVWTGAKGHVSTLRRM